MPSHLSNHKISSAVRILNFFVKYFLIFWFANSHNNFNKQFMLLAKSSSLPQIKVNFNKYQNFFSKKGSQKDTAMDEPQQEIAQTESQITTDRKKKAHLKNLEIIDRKSTIKSKVESYLTDSRKMGILQHNINSTHNRRSLTKISLQAMKPVHTETEQQKQYITRLKTELNQFFEKNQRMEREIKNTHAMTSQVKEKIIFYQQLAQKTWIHRYQLLNQREENLQYIRYETDRLKFMQERLKEINIMMRKRVKDAQNKLRTSQNQSKVINEIQAIRQDQLDKKLYLVKNYNEFQLKKSENLKYKSDEAIRNMGENQAAQLLKRHQKAITIMDKDEYETQIQMHGHVKLMKQLLFNQFYSKFLDGEWTKYSSYYEQYEKAEQLMKMHSMDRQALVQDSYKKSFEIKEDLQKKITTKQKQLAILTQKNKDLKLKAGQFSLQEIDSIEKRLENMKLQYRTGKKLIKDSELTEKQKYHRGIMRRYEEIDRTKKLLSRLRQWIKRQQKEFNITISKKKPLTQHFTSYVETISIELKNIQADYTLKPKDPPKITHQKANKFGNSKKKK